MQNVGNEHLMRLWHFWSSVNSFFNVLLSSGARCLIFGQTFRLLPYFLCANSEGSGETVQMRRLAWAFAGPLCDKYQLAQMNIYLVHFEMRINITLIKSIKWPNLN